MEYKIFRYVRHQIKIPYFLRFIFSSILIILSIIPILLPIFPGSLIVGLVMLVIGLMLIVSGNKIRHVIKIRKGILYLFKNIHDRNAIGYKMRDIKTHIGDILTDKHKAKYAIRSKSTIIKR